MRWLAIVNRHAGGLRARHADLLMAELGRVADEVVCTASAGHATEIARGAHAWDGIVVAGGDGTLFEVLQGLDRARQSIAIVPIGRGNSLARDLGILKTDVRRLRESAPTRIDLLRVVIGDTGGGTRELLSGSTVAIGYPSDVVRRAGGFRWCGGWCYAAAAAVTAPARASATLAYDGSPGAAREVTAVIVSNTRHLANFVAFPDASCADGIADVMELSGGRLRQLRHSAAILARAYALAPTHPFQARTAEITRRSGEMMDVMIDGEVMPGARAIRVSVEPAALSCHV